MSCLLSDTTLGEVTPNLSNLLSLCFSRSYLRRISVRPRLLEGCQALLRRMWWMLGKEWRTCWKKWYFTWENQWEQSKHLNTHLLSRCTCKMKNVQAIQGRVITAGSVVLSGTVSQVHQPMGRRLAWVFFLQQTVILCIYICISTGQAKCGHKHPFHMLSAKKSTLSCTWSLAPRNCLCKDKRFTAHDTKPSADAIVIALNVCLHPKGI